MAVLFKLYVHMCILVITGSLQNSVDETIPQSQMGNVFQNIWQNSANSMSKANGMGNQINTNCFMSGIQMSGMGPVQMGHSNIMTCPCLTYDDRTGCPLCPCKKHIPKTSMGITKSTTDDNRITTPPIHQTGVTSKNVTVTGSTHVTTSSLHNVTDKLRTYPVSHAYEISTYPSKIMENNKTKIGNITDYFGVAETGKHPVPEVPEENRGLMRMRPEVVYTINDTSPPVEPETETNERKEDLSDKKYLTEEKSFTLAVALGVALLFISVVAITFLILWRRTERILKRERNELYFTEKSFRTDSLKSIDETTRNSILSLIGVKRRPPDLPFRTPPLTPTASPVLTSTPTDVAQIGRTAFKIPPDDPKNDYLELI